MKSIKVYLVIAVLSVMTLTIFVAALHGYQSSMARADILFDRQLDDVIRLLTHIHHEPPSSEFELVSAGKLLATEPGEKSGIIYQLWSGDQLVASNVGLTTALSDFAEGFSYRNFLDFRWRVGVHHDPVDNIWVMVAERADIRFLLAENLVTESIWPVVVSLPVAALLIWWFIGSGLALLNRLAADLRLKQVEDLSPLQYEQVPRELVVVVQSINRLFRRLEAAFRRERNFAADAAHELRTPISALKVHVHNLRQALPGAEANLTAVDNDLSRLSHLVEQILLLYRTNPENSGASMQPLDLTALTQDVVSEMYTDFEQREQNIELLTEARHVIEGDANFLRILLRNLLSNANKYTPIGGDIEVEIESTQAMVSLTVLDSGPGIDESEFERVFDRFYRVGGDRHASGAPGCGLGLAIVKHIADLHRAQVRFYCRASSSANQSEMFAVCVEFPKPAEISEGDIHQ